MHPDNCTCKTCYRPAAQPAVEGTMTAEQFYDNVWEGDNGCKLWPVFDEAMKFAEAFAPRKLAEANAEIERLKRASWVKKALDAEKEVLRLTGLLNEANSNAEAAAGEMAQQFHETYERLAPSFGYETRKASAKPWAEVPEQNKKLMIAVCTELRSRLRGETK